MKKVVLLHHGCVIQVQDITEVSRTNASVGEMGETEAFQIGGKIRFRLGLSRMIVSTEYFCTTEQMVAPQSFNMSKQETCREVEGQTLSYVCHWASVVQRWQTINLSSLMFLHVWQVRH